MTDSGRRRDGQRPAPGLIATLVVLYLLGVVLGAALYQFQVFPAPLLRDAFLGVNALYERYVRDPAHGRYHPDIWQGAHRAETGVTVHDRARAFEGLTLYTSAHAQKAVLIDMEGRVVHEWAYRFRQAWPEAHHVGDPVAPDRIFWRMAHLYPNGDLLAIYVGQGDTPWGYGLIKLDKDSRPIWRYPGRVHHDLDVAEDGRIYTLLHRISERPAAGLAHLEPPFLDDMIAVLSPAGHELERISLLEALQGSKYRPLLWLIDERNSKRDFLHANAITVVRQPLSVGGITLEKGHVLVSLRELQAVVAIDPESGAVVWALRGPWVGQHDPDLLDNGNMLIFDNRGHLGPGGLSRVVEFDPVTQAVHWEYAGTPEAPLWSSLRSRQQRLPNGNTLITESDTGRLVEVSADKRIVWEFLSPHRGGQESELVAVITAGQRFARDRLHFLTDASSNAAAQRPPRPGIGRRSSPPHEAPSCGTTRYSRNASSSPSGSAIRRNQPGARPSRSRS